MRRIHYCSPSGIGRITNAAYIIHFHLFRFFFHVAKTPAAIKYNYHNEDIIQAEVQEKLPIIPYYMFGVRNVSIGAFAWGCVKSCVKTSVVSIRDYHNYIVRKENCFHLSGLSSCVYHVTTVNIDEIKTVIQQDTC